MNLPLDIRGSAQEQPSNEPHEHPNRPLAVAISCHRVVKADGSVAGYRCAGNARGS
jgi:hypothetical protein